MTKIFSDRFRVFSNIISLKNSAKEGVFYLIVIINASIVFSFEYFPTLDSGAHAYNSNIIVDLLFGSVYDDYFIINSELVPNLTAHVVMAAFNSFLPFNTAEKLTLFIYFVSFPILFRLLLSKFKKGNTWFVFLVFPFTHFATLYWGFYNFAYGVLFFLLGIIYWISNRDNFTIKNIVVYFFITILSYFSHLVSFIAMVMFCGVYEILDMILNLNQLKLKTFLNQKIRLFFKGLLAFALPLYLTYSYFEKRPELGNDVFLEKNELNRMLLDGDIFKSFGSGENAYSKPLFYIIVVLFLYAIISRIFNYYQDKRKYMILQSDVFLVFSVIFFYLFYTQPDSDGYGGYISIRLALFANLLLAIWIALSIKRDLKIEILSFILVVFLSFQLILGKKESLGWLSSQLSNFDGVGDHLSDGDLVASVFIANYNWLGNHFSNYLGADKNVIVLDNYEASSGYFPVVWKNPNSEVVLRNPNSADDVYDFKRKVMNYSNGNIKFILVYGSQVGNEFCNLLINEIENDFMLEWNHKDVFLYRKK
jgi:hypothetical protein